MNRKEDSMRRLSGEKTGLKAGPLINSSIILFLFFSLQSYCQIPINGFCSLNSVEIPAGFQSIVQADLNFDGNDELICYSSPNKKLGILFNNSDGQPELKEFKLNSQLSRLKQLINQKDSTIIFATIERKLRQISLLSISLDSVREQVGEITFDSYPENIFTGDIDLNGTQEILVSGTGFDGLSVLFTSGINIGEKKIISGTSFSEAIFVDLNGDGFLDVLAFNILDNSLQFYFNNTSGEFRLRRSDQFSDKINFLQSVDLDGDGFQEIIYSINDRVEILFGDFQSSYKEKTIIQLDSIPSSIQSGDFNRDKYPDLALATLQGRLNIHFGKGDGNFHEGITYLQESSGFTFTIFNSEISDNIACLFESGEIKYIMSLDDFSNDRKIVPSIQAGAVKNFNFLNDETPDICFVDEFDNSMKLFLNDKRGIPVSFYSFRLADSHKEIMVDEFFKRRKIFYFYTKGSPLIEVFRYNFYTNKLYRKQLYAPGEILDLTFQRVDSTLVNIFLVYNKNSKLYLGKFENRDLSVTFREYPFIDRNAILAGLFAGENPKIYYWKSEGASFQFKSAEVKSGPNIYKTYFEIPKSDSLIIRLYRADIYRNDYPSLISLVQNRTDSYLQLLSGDKISAYKNVLNYPHSYNKKFGRGFFGETSIKGIINFTLYAEDDDYIYRPAFIEKDKTFTLSRMLVAENLSDYFFAKLDQKNYYLVYSNKDKGYLLITSLRK